MGKGDKKSRRGKIILGTFGVRRLRKKTEKANVAAVKAKKEIIKTAEIEKVVVKPVEKVVQAEPVEAVIETVAKPKVEKEKAPAKSAKPAKEKQEAKEEKTVKAEKQAKELKVKKEKKAE